MEERRRDDGRNRTEFRRSEEKGEGVRKAGSVAAIKQKKADEENSTVEISTKV